MIMALMVKNRGADAAAVLSGVLFAATQDVDKWRCEGLKDGDPARMQKPSATK